MKGSDRGAAAATQTTTLWINVDAVTWTSVSSIRLFLIYTLYKLSVYSKGQFFIDLSDIAETNRNMASPETGHVTILLGTIVL